MSDNPLVNLDECQKKALEIVKNEPHRNLFIQGQAGTGKSTLINSIKEELENQKKLYAVVAPSGIAAELIGGTTIHSLFKLGARDYFPLNIVEEYQQYQDIVKHIDTLIIDEVSMLRADVFDTIDMLCQKAKNNGAPFGAIRVILVGDLFQLPPIYKHEKPEESRPYMKNTYGNEYPFFFEAHCYAHGNFGFTELTTVHRQNGDSDFISNLRIISQGDSKDINRALEYFNQRVISGENDKEVPIVTATRNNADAENSRRLNELTGAPRIFEATIEGKYPETDYPVPQTLELKLNARVMVCKNDHNEKYVNGSMGRVAAFGNDNITVLLDNGNFVTLQRTVWNKEEYVKADNGQLTSRTIGSYEQYPLKLAYAITIHKSQGQTWDKVLIDLGQTAFAPGQVYVALSRVKTIQGVHLARSITRNDIKIDGRVRAFLNRESIAQAPVNDDTHPQESTSEDSAETTQGVNISNIIEPINAKLRVSKISIYNDRRTSIWTVDNGELDNDLYLQAGKRDIIDRNKNLKPDSKIYIYKIKGGSYSIEDFVPCNTNRFNGGAYKEDASKRDIQIDVDTHKEALKGTVDFSRHLWCILDYYNNRITIYPDGK